MRRVPTGLLIFAPLLLGLLYALGHALLAPRPTLATLAPADAVFVQRFRNLAAFDRCSFGPRKEGSIVPRELLASERNVPGLPGVDIDGPLHMIQLPRTMLRDSSMAVFSVADADAFERAFNRPDLIERGSPRHAQHLVVRGSWAAVAPSRDAARRIGTDGIAATDRGEDHALAADVPRLVDHALSLASAYPWRPILTALGIDMEAASSRHDPDTGALIVTLPGLERVERIRAAWKTARMWAWMDEGRLRIDLEPAEGLLAQMLAGWAEADPVAGPSPAHPDFAACWLSTPAAGGPTLLAWLASDCGLGVPDLFPYPIAKSMFGEDPWTPPGGRVLAWGVPATGRPESLALGVAAPLGHLPNLALFYPDEDVVIERGGTEDMALLALHPGARKAIADMKTHLARGTTFVEPEPPEAGLRALAHFGMKAESARRLLGGALEPGGFLASLQGGNIEGALWTDGRTLRLEVRVGR